jgi:hypothetical protein
MAAKEYQNILSPKAVNISQKQYLREILTSLRENVFYTPKPPCCNCFISQ